MQIREEALPSLSKCWFRREKFRFLGYVVFSYVVLTFRCSPDFYRDSIQGFRWITAPLTSMLKTTRSSDLAPRELGTDEVVGNSGRADEKVVDLSKSSKSRRIVKKSKNCQKVEESSKSRRIVKKSKNLKGLKSYKGHQFEGTQLSTSTSSFWSRSPTRRKTTCRLTPFWIWW